MKLRPTSIRESLDYSPGYAYVPTGEALLAHQFWRLADFFRSWSAYVSIEIMLGAGLTLFPDVQEVYACALAISFVAWQAQGQVVPR